jgi:type IV secretory pathway TraG/TraD family ATPase VirD4
MRWKVTADIVSIFADVWKLGPETPRLLYYLRAGVRALLDMQGTTLLDLRRVLTDGSFRSHILRRGTDRETKQTWIEFSQKDTKQQAIEIGSLQNKVAALADPLPLRYILGQGSTIHMSQVLTSGTCLVLDLSDLGDEPAALIGALVINQFKQSAEAARTPQPYDLFIDEFQSFGTHTIATILSEARKWKLNLTIAHQFISQLDEEIRDAVLGNCGTLISFRVAAEDAPLIARALDWSATDLMNRGMGQYRFVSTFRGNRTDATLAHTNLVELVSCRFASIS